MEETGLVRSRRAGRDRVWELETKRLADVRRYLDKISAQWGETIVRLRSIVETKTQ